MSNGEHGDREVISGDGGDGNADTESEIERQRRAIQEFMISGGSGREKKKQKSKQKHCLSRIVSESPRTFASPPSGHKTTSKVTGNLSIGSNNSTDSKPLHMNSKSSNNASNIDKLKQAKWKRFRALSSAFESVLIEWIHIDDQLEQIVDSISNIRKRCWITSTSLWAEKQEQEGTGHDGSITTSDGVGMWKCYGYRSKYKVIQYSHETMWETPVLSLTVEDMELTLSDELIQHEKMIALCRKYLSQLSNEQESMSRRLDDLMMLYMDHTYSTVSFNASFNEPEHGDSDNDSSVITEKVNQYQELYKTTAGELYRKQILAEKLFQSSTNGLIVMGLSSDGGMDQQQDGSGGTSASITAVVGENSASKLLINQNPRQIAKNCAATWSRTCRQSELLQYTALLDSLVRNSVSTQDER